MPDRRTPSASEQRAEKLAQEVAARALLLVSADAEKAQARAVARAVRDANIDRDLSDHQRQLGAINGSQKDMARSLDSLQTAFHELTAAQQAVAKYVVEQTGNHFSRRTLWIAASAAIATWLMIIATLLSTLL